MAPVHGGDGGSAASVTLAPDEYITGASVGYSNNVVLGLQLRTMHRTIVVGCFECAGSASVTDATPVSIDGIQLELQHFSGKAGSYVSEITLHWRIPGGLQQCAVCSSPMVQGEPWQHARPLQPSLCAVMEIRTSTPERCVDGHTDPGVTLFQWYCTRTPTQMFMLVPPDNGGRFFNVKVPHSLCWDASGTRIEMQHCSGGSNQLFSVTKRNDTG